MGQYSKPALELLCDQIRRDNPNLDIKLDSDTLLLLSGPLTTNLGSSGRNTRIRVNGVMGAGSSGKRELFYDRLNLVTYTAKMPTGMVVTFDNAVHTLADALPNINDAFGLMLTPEDIRDGTTVLPFGNTPTQITVNLAADCLNFTGLLTFKWRRGAAGYYPESGPGTKQMLFGDINEGYFGTVTARELLSAGDFYNQMAVELSNKASLIPQNDPNLYYLKFAIDGKFVFVPTRNLVTAVTWEQLYRMGAIDASGHEASFPPTTVNGVDQNALLAVESDGKTYWLRPRLARLNDVDPAPSAKGDPESDFARLFNKVHKGANGTGFWDDQPVTGTGVELASNFWYQNSLEGDTTQAHLGTFNLGSIYTALKGAVSNGRPVIELMDPNHVLLPVRNATYEIVGPARPIVFDIADTTVHLTPPAGIGIDLYGYAPVIYWQGVDSDHIHAPTNVYVNGNVDFVQPIYWSTVVTHTV